MNNNCRYEFEGEKNERGYQKIGCGTAGREIAPTMQKAEQMLIKAGIEETKISVRIVDGSHNAASDILDAANRYACGTIVMGQRGVTGVKEYSMGSVCRKVLQNSKAMALWLVP